MIKKSVFILTIMATVVMTGSVACAQESQPADPQKSKHDSMESMNERGDKVMGFDHTRTTHHFLLRANGGVIQIEANEKADTASRDEIRQHMRHIAKMFGEGNFSAPMLIHEQNPPGAEVMKQLKAKIKYEFGENERGAFIRMSTDDAEALKAIHEFLRFQIKEHMTGDPLKVGQ
jgi:hypothetical protein